MHGSLDRSLIDGDQGGERGGPGIRFSPHAWNVVAMPERLRPGRQGLGPGSNRAHATQVRTAGCVPPLCIIICFSENWRGIPTWQSKCQLTIHFGAGCGSVLPTCSEGRLPAIATNFQLHSNEGCQRTNSTKKPEIWGFFLQSDWSCRADSNLPAS